jgi:hypothetical protein
MILVKKNKLEEEFKELNVKVKYTTVYYRTNDCSSYNDGLQKANNVNLQRPINTSNTVRGLLNG